MIRETLISGPRMAGKTTAAAALLEAAARSGIPALYVAPTTGMAAAVRDTLPMRGVHVAGANALGRLPGSAYGAIVLDNAEMMGPETLEAAHGLAARMANAVIYLVGEDPSQLVEALRLAREERARGRSLRPAQGEAA